MDFDKPLILIRRIIRSVKFSNTMHKNNGLAKAGNITIIMYGFTGAFNWLSCVYIFGIKTYEQYWRKEK